MSGYSDWEKQLSWKDRWEKEEGRIKFLLEKLNSWADKDPSCLLISGHSFRCKVRDLPAAEINMISSSFDGKLAGNRLFVTEGRAAHW